MANVLIHRFEIYDITNDVMRRSRRMGTAEGIRRIGGTLVPYTETPVDEIHVDGDGLTRIDFDPVRGE